MGEEMRQLEMGIERGAILPRLEQAQPVGIVEVAREDVGDVSRLGTRRGGDQLGRSQEGGEVVGMEVDGSGKDQHGSRSFGVIFRLGGRGCQPVGIRFAHGAPSFMAGWMK